MRRHGFRPRVVISAKECIPKRQVRKILGVVPELMMDPMGFRALDQKSDPARSAQIQVVKYSAMAVRNV
jgi:hypothetical protein